MIRFLPPTLYFEVLCNVHFPQVVHRSPDQSLESTAEVTRTSHVEKEVGAEAEEVEELQEALPRVDAVGELLVGQGYEKHVDTDCVARHVE